MADKVKWLRPVSGATATSPDMPQKTTITFANLSNASGMAVDKDHNIYVSDSAKHVIFKYRWGSQTAPIVFAGSYNTAALVDGQGTAARFNQPGAMAIDASGVLWVIDVGNNRIRRIDENANVYTVSATDAAAGDPICVDASGNIFFVEAS